MAGDVPLVPARGANTRYVMYFSLGYDTWGAVVEDSRAEDYYPRVVRCVRYSLWAPNAFPDMTEDQLIPTEGQICSALQRVLHIQEHTAQRLAPVLWEHERRLLELQRQKTMATQRYASEAMPDEICHHDKVYKDFIFATFPSQRPWICRKCGAEGMDRDTLPKDFGEYDRLKREKERDAHA